MDQFNKRIIAASIVLAFGISSAAFANPTINERDVNPHSQESGNGDLRVDNTVTKSATATSDQSGSGVAANEYSTATDSSDNSVDNRDNSVNTADSNNDNSVDNTNNSVNTADSNNDNSVNTADSNNDNSVNTADSNNDNSNNSVNTADSNNDNSNSSVNTANSNNTNNSNNDNSDNSVNTANSNNTNNSNNDNSNHSINSSYNDNSSANANAVGSAAANGGGDAISHYSVNNSSLSGAVTGAGTSTDVHGGSGDRNNDTALTASNNIQNSLNGSAGINQVVMNHGTNALAQQQVSFQGNVNVGQ